jgi:YVTN family beta-propeller protein
VGLAPERITVGPDDTIYVSNRGERTVSVIQRGQWQEAARISVGVEPTGLAVTPDGKTLYVVNATSLQDPSTGTLMAIDTASRNILWDLPVGEEPRGVAILGDGHVAITLYKQADLVVVDPSQPQVVVSGTSLNDDANNPPQAALQGKSGGAPVPGIDVANNQETFHARGMASLTVGPDGNTLYAPTLWSSNAIIPLVSTASEVLPPPDAGTIGDCGGGAAYGGGGSSGCGPITDPNGVVVDANPPGGPVVLGGLVTFAGNTGTPKVDFVPARGNQSSSSDYPASVLHVQNGGEPWQEAVQEPVAAVVDPTGSFLYVVNRASNNVAVVPTSRTASSQNNNAQGPVGSGGDFNTPPSSNFEAPQPWVALASVGAGPTGIALANDNRRVFVFNALDHSISTLVSDGSGGVTNSGSPLTIGSDTLPADQVVGRRMFFSAVDTDVTALSVSISCSGCHLEGREDGQVWHFEDGPRQTMSLAGRMLDKTAPYHWSGALPSISRFMDVTIAQRMGGNGITEQQEIQIAQYLVAAPPADNPFRGAALNASQQRGALVFQMAACNTCHTGEALTNNGFANVGTASTNAANPDNFTNMPNGLNVPSLLGVGRTAPYLHDGSAPTLKARVEMSLGTNVHGNLTGVNDQMVDDLVAYLQTL